MELKHYDLSPPLGIGVRLEAFHSDRTQPVDKDKLNNLCRNSDVDLAVLLHEQVTRDGIRIRWTFDLSGWQKSL